LGWHLCVGSLVIHHVRTVFVILFWKKQFSIIYGTSCLVAIWGKQFIIMHKSADFSIYMLPRAVMEFSISSCLLFLLTLSSSPPPTFLHNSGASSLVYVWGIDQLSHCAASAWWALRGQKWEQSGPLHESIVILLGNWDDQCTWKRLQRQADEG
jgi:hypothetical protein